MLSFRTLSLLVFSSLFLTGLLLSILAGPITPVTLRATSRLRATSVLPSVPMSAVSREAVVLHGSATVAGPRG